MRGIEDVAISALTKAVVVTHCPIECCAPAELLVERLNAANLGASLVARGEADGPKKRKPSEWLLEHTGEVHATITVMIFLAALALSTCRSEVDWLVYIITALVGAVPIAQKAGRALGLLQIDVSVLLVAVVIGSLSTGNYFDVALLVVIYGLAELVEHRAMVKVARALNAAMHLSVTRTATLASNGKVVPVAELKIGDAVAIRPGEECPVDGEVIAGSASVSEAALTGEALPIQKQRGSHITSGSLLLGGYAEVRLTAAPGESTLSKMQDEVANAQAMRGETQMLVDRVAGVVLPLVLMAALANVAIGPMITGTPVLPWLHRSLVMLVLCCPCALVLSAPIPTTCAIAAAAGRGVLIKRPDVIQGLAKIRAVALDKTGTLTRGEFSVVAVENFAGRGREASLRLVAAVEAKSAHPLAAAVVSAAVGCAAEAYESGGLPEVKRFKNLDGMGVKGEVDAGGSWVKVVAGNDKVLEMERISDVDRSSFVAFQAKHGLATCIAVVIDGALELGIALNDTLRPTAQQAVDELRTENCWVAMLTGDAPEAATEVAQTLGLALFQASMLPSDKRDWVDAREAKGTRTLMIGDGINDSNAMASATVGVAMGEGCMALAARTADMCIMSNDLNLLPQSIALCKYAHRVVKFNIVLVAFIKVMTIILAFMGRLPLWLAVLVDLGSLLFVLLVGVSVLHINCWDSKGSRRGPYAKVIGGEEIIGEEHV